MVQGVVAPGLEGTPSERRGLGPGGRLAQDAEWARLCGSSALGGVQASCPSVAPWLGHLPESASPPLWQAWWVVAPAGRLAQVGGDARPCLALNRRLPLGSVPVASACTRGGTRGWRSGRGPFARTVPTPWDLPAAGSRGAGAGASSRGGRHGSSRGRPGAPRPPGGPGSTRGVRFRCPGF